MDIYYNPDYDWVADKLSKHSLETGLNDCVVQPAAFIPIVLATIHATLTQRGLQSFAHPFTLIRLFLIYCYPINIYRHQSRNWFYLAYRPSDFNFEFCLYTLSTRATLARARACVLCFYKILFVFSFSQKVIRYRFILNLARVFNVTRLQHTLYVIVDTHDS